MRRPSPAILGSIALHAGVVALAFVSWPRKTEELTPLVASVPVSIVSEETVQAAAAENPQPEPSPDDAATAPVQQPDPTPPTPEPTPPQPTPTPPRPTPPKPTPTPTPPAPTPRPTPQPTPRPTPTPTPAPRPAPTPPKPQPTPPRPTPPAPTPPRPTPPAPTPSPPTKAPANPRPAPANPSPAPQRPEPGLDLNALAGPARPTNNAGRPAAGQQGAGQASRATGQQLAALGSQVTPNWNLNCDLPGMDSLVIRVTVRLTADGQIVGSPRLEQPRTDATWRAASDAMLRALRATAPFDVPAGFTAQEVPFRFETARQCANR